MFETLTEYALDRLRAHGEEGGARREHAAIFLAFAERAAPELLADDPGWWIRMESERANLHQALAWLEQQGAGDEMLRLAVALERFWIPHGHLSEGRAWLERALALTRDHPLRGAALFAAANIADKQGDHEQSLAWITEGLAANRALGQPYGKLLLLLGGNARRHDLDEACALYEEAIVQLRAEEDDQWLAWGLGTLGVTLLIAGRDPARGAALTAEALALHRSLGNEIGEGVLLAQLGTAAMVAGDTRTAAGRYRESLRVLEGVGDAWHLVLPLSGAAELAGTIGAWAEAVQLLAAAERILERTGQVAFLPEEGVPIARVRADGLRALGDLDFTQEHSVGQVLAAPEYLETAKAVLDAVLDDGRGRRPLVARPSRGPMAGADLGGDLTPRERDVLSLLCQRYTDPEIAAQLFISPRTANRHVSNILSKLGSSNRREAAAIAARRGLT
jgi:non-specific serine/threonine protein kinase